MVRQQFLGLLGWHSQDELEILAVGQGATADYIDCGSWAEKAIKEARKIGTVNVATSTKDANYSRLPRQSEWQ